MTADGQPIFNFAALPRAGVQTGLSLSAKELSADFPPSTLAARLRDAMDALRPAVLTDATPEVLVNAARQGVAVHVTVLDAAAPVAADLLAALGVLISAAEARAPRKTATSKAAAPRPSKTPIAHGERALADSGMKAQFTMGVAVVRFGSDPGTHVANVYARLPGDPLPGGRYGEAPQVTRYKGEAIPLTVDPATGKLSGALTRPADARTDGHPGTVSWTVLFEPAKKTVTLTLDTTDTTDPAEPYMPPTATVSFSCRG